MSTANEMTLTLNVADMLGDPAELRSNIIDEAGERLADKFRGDVASEMKQLVRKHLEGYVASRIDELFSKSFQETDHYGNSRGTPPKTLAELIVEDAKRYMTEKVNARSGNRDGAYGSDAVPRYVWLARSAAEEMVKREMKDAIEEAKAEIKRAVAGKMADVFRKALVEAAKL